MAAEALSTAEQVVAELPADVVRAMAINACTEQFVDPGKRNAQWERQYVVDRIPAGSARGCDPDALLRAFKDRAEQLIIGPMSV